VAELKEVNLETVAGGVVPVYFLREMQNVLMDIDNPNTDPKAVRKITIEIAFKPTEARDAAIIAVSCKSKLAGLRPIGKTLYLTKRGGRLLALEKDPNQTDLWAGDEEPASAGAPGRHSVIKGGAPE
jgi:hypothetical protein